MTGAVANGHVAHILPWPNVGGTEIATLRLIRAAASLGYRSTVFHMVGADAVADVFRDDADLQEMEEIEPSYRHGWRYIARSRVLARRFRDRGVHAIHCADIRGAFLSGLAGKIARVPVLCHVRNRYDKMSRRDRSFLRFVDNFFFVSEQTWKDFAYPVAASRGSVCYDGIRIPEPAGPETPARIRASLGIAGDETVVGMVARVARQKDYETLARAAAEVLRAVPHAKFVVVGDYQDPSHREYHREILDTLESLQIADRFVFTGHRTDIDDMLESFDVFVLSTHWEGFPLVILEAMAHGLPVVATAVDGIPEVVDPDRTGLLHIHGDHAGLAAALVRLLKDPGIARRLGTNARQRIEREFSQDQFAERVRALYERLVPGGGPDRGLRSRFEIQKNRAY
jgi:glycosyltransferase involved in cell wall biosynthesis